MKKIIFILILVLVFSGALFAQEDRPANIRSNWLSGELSLLGAGLRYERMLSQKWSVGINAYWNSLFWFWNELEAGLSFRFYPCGRTFFTGLGLGFHIHSGTYEYEYSGGTYTWFGTVTGGAVAPEIGWKIDVGKEGGFFIQPGIKVPVTFGVLNDTIFSGGHTGKEFKVGAGVVVYCGLGGAF